MKQDAPWAKSRTVQIKAGERLKVRDAQHRTKGAKKGKNYRESKRPDGFDFSRSETETIGLHMNSRQRYKARRQARMATERANGVRTKVAPALKGKDMRPNPMNTIAVDYREIHHDGMSTACDPEGQHAMHHQKTATPIKRSCM